MRWLLWISGIVVSVLLYLVLRSVLEGPWDLVIPLSLAVSWTLILGLLGEARDRLRSSEHPAVQSLVDFIRDSSEDLRAREQALVRYVAQNKKAAPRLLDELFAEAPELRSTVVRAWGRLKHAAAVPTICGIIEGSDRLLGRSAAVALGVFDSPEAERGLVLCLDHPSRSVVWDAVESLRRVGREQGFEGLSVLLERLGDATDAPDEKLIAHVEPALAAVRRRVGGHGRLSLLPRVAGALSEAGAPRIPGALSVDGEEANDGGAREPLRWFGFEEAVFTFGFNTRGIIVVGMNVEGVVAIGGNALGVVSIGLNALGTLLVLGGNLCGLFAISLAEEHTSAIGFAWILVGQTGLSASYSVVFVIIYWVIQLALLVFYIRPQLKQEGLDRTVHLRLKLQAKALKIVCVGVPIFLVMDLLFLDVDTLLTSLGIQ